MANPTTNYGWPMPTSTDLVTDLPADFALFGQPVDTSLKALNPETTLGDIAYRSSTSNTNTRLGIGTTGQVLTVAAGVPSWATAASGLTVVKARTTFSAVANTGTTFDSIFTSSYRSYLIVFDDFYAVTDADGMRIQFRYAGPTTETAAYYWGKITTSGTVTSGVGVGFILLSANAGTSGAPNQGQIYVNNVFGSSGKPTLNGMINAPGAQFANMMQGTQDNARVYTGFILSSASSNISGAVTVYGLAV